jgi:Flp pilus assembly protein TadD
MITTCLLASALVVIGGAAPAGAQEPTPSAEAAALKKVRTEAASFREARDWKHAAGCYSELVKLDPNDAMAWRHVGYALHVEGRRDEAVVAHKKAAEFEKTRIDGLYNAACVFALEGERDEAVA